MVISHLNNNAAPPILSEAGSAVAEGVHPIWIRTFSSAPDRQRFRGCVRDQGSARSSRAISNTVARCFARQIIIHLKPGFAWSPDREGGGDVGTHTAFRRVVSGVL